MSDTYYDSATGTWKKYTGRMAYRPYREAILSGAFVPSARALEVDAILDEVQAGGPEKYPEYYTWLSQMGWVLTHPLQSQNSLTEHTAWVNSGLGRSFFGGQEAPVLNDSGTNTVDNVPNGSSSNAGSTDNNASGGNNNGGNNAPAEEEKPIGWYWTGSAWLPIYQGEGAPVDAIVAPTSTQPTSPPVGWTDPNANNGGTSNNSGGNTGSGSNPPAPEPPAPEPEPPLYTPTADQFYMGMFTAADLLSRDGGEIKSPFYQSAREKVLQSLADQAASQGRTQNTAEEIAMAQRGTPSLPASGLFGPNAYALSGELFNA